MVSALRATGLPPAMAIQTFQTLVAYLAAALAMAVQAGERDERWTQGRNMINALPGLTSGDELFAVGSAEQFAFGLRLLLAGVRAEAKADREGQAAGDDG